MVRLGRQIRWFLIGWFVGRVVIMVMHVGHVVLGGMISGFRWSSIATGRWGAIGWGSVSVICGGEGLGSGRGQGTQGEAKDDL